MSWSSARAPCPRVRSRCACPGSDTCTPRYRCWPSIHSRVASISRCWRIRTADTAVSRPASPNISGMIDLRLLRSDPAQVRAALARRGDAGVATQLDEILAIDARRRALVTELDKIKAERNEASRADAQIVKQLGSLPADVVAQRRALGERITTAEAEVRTLDDALAEKTLYVPNLPLPDVPDGPASANVIVRSWGTPRPAGPEVKP